MTDNEIIKALECCASECEDACDDCPCVDGKCIGTTPDVLDLINRLQADLKFAKTINALQMEELQKAQAENERYKETYGCYPVWNVPCENVFVLSMSCDDYEDFKHQIKAEAIKEFAERLKEDAHTVDDDYSPNGKITYIEVADIDNLVKEMVGE